MFDKNLITGYIFVIKIISYNKQILNRKKITNTIIFCGINWMVNNGLFSFVPRRSSVVADNLEKARHASAQIAQ